MTDQDMPSDDGFLNDPPEDRRFFLKQSLALAGLTLSPVSFHYPAKPADPEPLSSPQKTVRLSLTINGTKRRLAVDPRTTLLDLLREQLGLTGTKKGCDFGQCGACTIHLDGQRVLACLSLAVMQNGRTITTIEGLTQSVTESSARLHPMQEAFIRHDGFQCGYCTPGQVMSAICCIREGQAGSEKEIQEYMSGNLCRCGAYPNIVKAILDVKNSGQPV
ncbi:(2Fe-2S)-binding protein [Larkinella sp. VNQ87]|uniref:(2Fe-2S)-binding protein n=1 Tax=Larkinella sp. VNQ87 TaxID=3400921 RepID=UPI003BFE0C83